MNKISNMDKASILSKALPYIQRYFGKIVVIKYGGNAMIDEVLQKTVMEDIVLLTLIGVKIVLVHGGGPDISEMLDKLNIESKFINGLRYTDSETAEIVQMVLCGKVNKNLVSTLNCAGGKAVGLCGLDAKMLECRKVKSEVDLGFVGEITKVRSDIICDHLEKGYIPVIATVGSDVEGNVYNINADTATSAISAALGAENLTLMTDVRGLLRDKDDADSLIAKVAVSEVPGLVNQGIISGGMVPKIQSCVDSIRNGVKKAFIIDGRVKHSILVELLTDEGIGTMFYSPDLK